MTLPLGPLIGSGRSADVFALGPDRVLRRYRRPIDVRREADLMVYLDLAGYPVPKVYDVDGPDLVMERLDGRDMLAVLGRKPWLIGRYARMLADLHDRLHEIDAPAGLGASFEPGDPPGRVLHLDFHPGNVMLTRRGPMVIDWVNAAAGPPGADVAMAYAIMASAETDLIPMPVRLVIGRLRAEFLRRLLASTSADPAPYLASAARERMRDPNARPSEIERLRRMAEQAEAASRVQ